MTANKLKKLQVDAKAAHDKLSAAYYAGTSGLTRGQFTQQHGKIWSDLEDSLRAGGHTTKPAPRRDLEAEIYELKAELAAITLRMSALDGGRE